MTQNNKFRLLDTAVFIAYVASVLVLVKHHEPWSDEAQSWIVARDLPFWKMIFGEMHYEVSPGLWQSILWIAQHVFHLPYAAMNWISAAFAIAGAGLLIFLAPFPRVVRYLMASSYTILYQYAIIARPYPLLLLCGAAAAIFYRKRRTLPLSICLALLCGISVHGIILAAALGAGALWQEAHYWNQLDRDRKSRDLVALAIVVVAAITAVAIARPAPDVVTMNPLKNGGIIKLLTTIEDVVVNPWWLGVPVLLILGAFATWRRQGLVFLLSVGGLLTFQCFFYGGAHHQGAIVIALIIALWVAYPDQAEPLPLWFKPRVLAALLALVFAVQTSWALRAWKFDYEAPYSGAADMAAFLHKIGVQRDQTSAFAFNSVAIQPYFDSNLFNNWPTAFVHHSRSAEPPLSKLSEETLSQYLIIPTPGGDVDPTGEQLASYGYIRLHVSPGRVLYNRGIWMTETFTLYGRTKQQSAQAVR